MSLLIVNSNCSRPAIGPPALSWTSKVTVTMALAEVSISTPVMPPSSGPSTGCTTPVPGGPSGPSGPSGPDGPTGPIGPTGPGSPSSPSQPAMASAATH